MKGQVTIAAVLLLLAGLCVHVESKKKPRESKSSFPPRTRHERNKERVVLEDGTCDLELNCRGGEGINLPVKLPVRGPRGPPGDSGAPGIPGSDGNPGLPGRPGLSAPTPKKVAFFAGLADNMGPVSQHTDITFDRVLTNVGKGYDPETGRFTAPYNGTYQFNVIVSAQGRQKAAVMILKNGGMVATVWAESIPYWATASNIAVLTLDKGDQVWLMLLNRASYLHGYMYSTFSGFIIFEGHE